jgi:hypothetical protein
MEYTKTIHILILAEKEIKAAYALLKQPTNENLERIHNYTLQLIGEKAEYNKRKRISASLECPIKKDCVQYNTKKCGYTCKYYKL